MHNLPCESSLERAASSVAKPQLANATSASNESSDEENARTVRLRSTPFFNAAGVLAWAKVGYESEQRRRGPVGTFIGLFSDGYRLGAVLAESVLRGETVTVIDGQDVLLKLTDAEFRLYRSANPTSRSSSEDGADRDQPDLSPAN